MAYRTTQVSLTNFSSASISVASPDRIRSWSRGEVTKPETINYRTQRSEKGGLFDEKIFGPEKDYECYCGKYRGIRYKGIICEKCGVEITRAIVRRERMGHIELCTPVSHVWFLRSVPSRIAQVLGLPSGEVEKVVYFAGYVVTRVDSAERDRVLKALDAEFKRKVKELTDEKGKDKLKELLVAAKKEIDSLTPGRVLDEAAYHRFSMRYGTLFEAEIGAEAIYNLCKNLDLSKLKSELGKALEDSGAAERERLQKRLSLVSGMHAGSVRPEWMFLTVIPVIPPALRPMVALDGGRHATSDLNDLYRRVINRNNRLRKLLEIKAPEVILRNEKRILQEAVDALIDNSMRHGGTGGAVSAAARRPLKSLSDNLKGKQGLFRQNLLGKRVDYSGRSVIVVGPDLKLNQCGLPKHMALELFRPFVIRRLLQKELAFNIRGANRLIDEGIPEVWAMLEDVIKDKYVLLNRAPTLHRLGIQAFKPVLIEGNAIQIHPLVCQAFNADFDGDQMAVHVPLSEEAQFEAKEIMASDRNILKPGDGEPIVSPRQDMVLGVYWLTRSIPKEKGEGKYFSSPNAAITAADFGAVSYRAPIKVLSTDSPKYSKFNGQVFETTVGRLLFNSALPSDYPYVNEELDRKGLSNLVNDLIERYSIRNIPPILDKIKTFGFTYATTSGVTWSLDDVRVPSGKTSVIEEARGKEAEIKSHFENGLLSEEERYREVIEIWHAAKQKVEKMIPDSLDGLGSVYELVKSGARGSIANLTQMAGMKGLITNPLGEILDFPIISSAKEGLTPIEYFITTHGARKGSVDTALKTASAGYLTRRLFDVAQDVVISEEDCGTKRSVILNRISPSGMEISLGKLGKGRFLAADAPDSSGRVLFKKGHFLSRLDAEKLEEAKLSQIEVRSPLTCETARGICARCYGGDLGDDQPVNLGEAVGTVAAQAIGEPGTQLTMRTFHSGGTASVGGDITQGLPRVEEIFERRPPKSSAVVSKVDGVVLEIRDDGKEKMIVVLPDEGTAKKKKRGVKDAEGKESEEYPVNYRRIPLVSKGERVLKGQVLTDGSVDLEELFTYAGRAITEQYIIDEISKIYDLQGSPVSRKHIEVIVRQMFSRLKVKEKGESSFSSGEVISQAAFEAESSRLKEVGGSFKAEPLIMGIGDVSLSRKSFLSAASFQHTTRTLINAAVRRSTDRLQGLKENVIIGRLIPAGTGFAGSPKQKSVSEAIDSGNTPTA